MSVLDARDPEDAMAIASFVNASFHNSTHTMLGGLPAAEYCDIDDYMLGLERLRDGTIHSDTENGWENARRLTEWFARGVELVRKKTPVSRLAFISKGPGGPVGVLTIRHELAAATQLGSIVVFPWKRLDIASIKGAPVVDGESFLIISDVATEGETIATAANRITRFGGIVPAALVALDRQQGAAESLRQANIHLHALMDLSDLPNIDDLLHLTISTTLRPKRVLDLGGLPY